MPITLTEAQQCAIASAIAPKDEKTAKAALPEGSTHHVDVTVRVRGVVTKGNDTPPANGERPADFDVFAAPVIIDALKRLKVTPADLRRVLTNAATAVATNKVRATEAHDQLAEVFANTQAHMVWALPPVPWTTAGKAASVRSDVTLEVIR